MNTFSPDELQRAVKGRLRCALRFDALTRVLYSTDASNHQVEPLGVAYPRDETLIFFHSRSG